METLVKKAHNEEISMVIFSEERHAKTYFFQFQPLYKTFEAKKLKTV